MRQIQFRIIERYGEVHIQQRVGFLGLWWWSTNKRYYGEGDAEQPIDYKTVEAAKKYIDAALATVVPPVITYYPAN